MKVNKTKSSHRDVIDEIVLSNSSKNIDAFNAVKDLPVYQCGVQVETQKLKFDTANKKDKVTCSIIQDIVNGVKTFTLKDEESYMMLVLPDGSNKQVRVHPTLIKFIKVCVASSVSVNVEYSEVVSDYTKELLRTIENIQLPITVPAETKLKKLILDRLNEFLMELCNDNNIPYSEAIVVTPKKEKKNKLLEATTIASGKK